MNRLRGLLLAIVIGMVIGGVVLPRIEGVLQAKPKGTPRTVDARGDLDPEEIRTIQLFKDCAPSVVYITTKQRVQNPWTGQLREVEAGEGSGFVWDDQGHVITNFHVIANARSATITMNDRTTYDAQLVGSDPEHDIVVLKIDAEQSKLKPVRVGTSKELQVGQKVFAIGDPFGWDQSLSTGVVSALGRSIKGVAGNQIEDVIQTDAAVNPGNSGGPLLDSAGRLVGVNTAIYSPSGANAGIGFAIPVDTVNQVVASLIERGDKPRAKIGFTRIPQLEQIVAGEGISGVPVGEVAGGSNAAAAGLQSARMDNRRNLYVDIIQKVDGKPVKNFEELFDLLGEYQPGDTVEIEVRRGDEIVNVKVKLS